MSLNQEKKMLKMSEEDLEFILQKFFKSAFLKGYELGRKDFQFEIETGYPIDQYNKAKKIVDDMFKNH